MFAKRASVLLEVVYDYSAVKALTRQLIESRPRNLWRYRELLPLDAEPSVGRHRDSPRWPLPLLERGRWSKAEVKHYLYERARVPGGASAALQATAIRAQPGGGRPVLLAQAARCGRAWCDGARCAQPGQHSGAWAGLVTRRDPVARTVRRGLYNRPGDEGTRYASRSMDVKRTFQASRPWHWAASVATRAAKRSKGARWSGWSSLCGDVAGDLPPKTAGRKRLCALASPLGRGTHLGVAPLWRLYFCSLPSQGSTVWAGSLCIAMLWWYKA